MLPYKPNIMVVTRSRKIAIHGEDGNDGEEKPPRKTFRRNFVITFAPKTILKKKPTVEIQDSNENNDGHEEEEKESNEASDSSVEEEDEESEEDENDEFDLPASIMENHKLRRKAEKIIEYIKQNSPSLETILHAKLRKKHKAELMEWFLVYENSMPMSEERMVLRRQVFQMFESYKKEYLEYKKHRKEVKAFEDIHNHNDLADLQYSILRLETSDDQKQVLYRKYTELREKEDMDEEFYKLKGWLKQALTLPFDRIKSYPKFDDVTSQLVAVRKVFDEELYGMDKVKEQLMLFIHGKIMNPDMKGCCLGLVGEPGVGKCLDPMTEVLLHDGSIQRAMNLKVGDCLMGDDSEPRVIESMCRGRQQMYKVVQQNGDPYTVNSSHILTLYHNKSGSLRDISISDYLNLSRVRREEYCGVKAGVRFPYRKLSFPRVPVRMMGRLWACQAGPNRFHLPPGLFGPDTPSFLVEASDGDGEHEIIDKDLASFLGTSLHHIPDEYKKNDATTRLEFLRGVADAAGVRYDLTYYIFLPRQRVEDMMYLIRSLGLYATRTKDHTITLSDPLEMLDGTGKAPTPGLVTYGIQVLKQGVGDYVGFIVSQNHRFLLKDFTITHNTSIARCLAKVMEFPFEQVSFGGVQHADFIKGFDFTYVGSRPGEIARCVSRMGYKNGIIFFDEYEKVSENSEITSSLLHITDFSQNSGFRDNFFNELTIDLSSIWFIYSMNDLPRDKALKDRIYSIHVDGYSEKEKVRIASDYLFPKNLVNIGKTKNDLVLTDEVVRYLVQKVCGEEKGTRNLEKAVKDMINKVYFLVTNQNKLSCSFMLPEKYFPLAFPVEVTNTMVDVFLKDFGRDVSKIPSFYV